MLTQNESMDAATASDGKRAPIASFWVGIMTSCISFNNNNNNSNHNNKTNNNNNNKNNNNNNAFL